MTLLHHLEARTGKNEAGSSPPREREAGRSDASHLEEDNTVRRESDEAPKQELEAGRDTTGQIIKARIPQNRFVIFLGIKRESANAQLSSKGAKVSADLPRGTPLANPLVLSKENLPKIELVFPEHSCPHPKVFGESLL